jgi:hypothetical protein
VRVKQGFWSLGREVLAEDEALDTSLIRPKG